MKTGDTISCEAKERKARIRPVLLSTPDAARFLGIGRTLFCSLASAGQIGPLPVRLGDRTLWRRKELALWVDAGCPSRERWQAMLPGPADSAPGSVCKISDF